MVHERPGEWSILPAPHLGDTYFTCSLAEAFLQRHGGELVRVVVPKRLWGISKMFPDARVAMIDPADLDVPVRKTMGASSDEPFELRPIDHWTYFALKYFGSSLPFTKMYHDLLDLPFPSFAPPRISPEIQNAAEKCMERLNLPVAKTAILVPFSKSLAPFPASFWEELAFALDRRGWVVTTNVTADQIQMCVPGTRPLECSSDELIPVAELAGMVIASRCGVCDILATAQTDLRILYQNHHLERIRMPGVTLEWNLGPCGLPDRASYFRADLYEPNKEFIARILNGTS